MKSPAEIRALNELADRLDAAVPGLNALAKSANRAGWWSFAEQLHYVAREAQDVATIVRDEAAGVYD